MNLILENYSGLKANLSLEWDVENAAAFSRPSALRSMEYNMTIENALTALSLIGIGGILEPVPITAKFTVSGRAGLP